MFSRQRRLMTFVLSVCLLGLGAQASRGQAQPAQPVGDGLIRSEVSLTGRTVTIAYAPDLKTSPAAGAMKARDLVGQLETAGAVRVGTLDLGTNAPAATATASAGAASSGPAVMRYGLWLESSPNAWLLQVADAADTLVGAIELDRQDRKSVV